MAFADTLIVVSDHTHVVAQAAALRLSQRAH